jgi:hypothetical protein
MVLMQNRGVSLDEISGSKILDLAKLGKELWYGYSTGQRR